MTNELPSFQLQSSPADQHAKRRKSRVATWIGIGCAVLVTALVGALIVFVSNSESSRPTTKAARRSPLDWNGAISLDGHSDAVTALSFSPSGQLLASCGMDQTIRIWNVSSGELVQLFKGHLEPVPKNVSGESDNSIAFLDEESLVSASSQMVLTSEGVAFEGRVLKWQIGQAKSVSRIDGGLHHVAVSRKLGLIAALPTASGDVGLWEIPSLQPSSPATITHRKSKNLSWLKFSRRGDYLIAAYELRDSMAIDCWSMPDCKFAGTVEAYRGIQPSLTTDGDSIAFLTRKGTIVIAALSDITNGDQAYKFPKVEGGPVCMGVAPSNRRAIIAGRKGTLATYDLESGEQVTELSGHEQRITELLISPDGEILASADAGGLIKLHEIKNE